MRLKIPRQYALFALLALIWPTLACQSGVSSSKPCSRELQPERVTGKRGGSLIYRVSDSPTTFNYLQASGELSLMVAFYLMGGRLVEFDHEERRYVPGLAEKWVVGEDGRSVEVTLRDGIKFSDGHPISAEDVSFTLRAIYDIRTASPIFRDAMMIGNRQIEANVVDTRRLWLIFPDVVAAPEGYLSNLAVLPRHVLEADFNRGALRSAYSLTADPNQVITAGAFAAESAVPNESIKLKRNPHYWKKDPAGAPLPYLDQFVIEVVKDANNAFTRLQQGTLDIHDRLRPADYAELCSQPGVTQVYDLGPGLQTEQLWFNLNEGESHGSSVVDPVKRAWFNDLRFRQAVSYAFDRKTIALNLKGLATPLYGFVSPGNREWAAADLPPITRDLDRARSLLLDAGFATRGPQDRPELYDSKGNRVEFTLILPSTSQPRKDMAIVIQGDLAQLGINLQVASIDSREVERRISESYEYDATLFTMAVSEPDPSSYTNFLSNHPWSPKQLRPATTWEARIDDLLVTQSRETNRDRRRAAFHEIQRILAEQLPMIPVVARHIAAAANRRVGNYRPSATLPFSLWNAEELFVR